MNKYKILNTNNDFQLQVSIPTTWDFANRGDLIDDYESIVAKEMVGVPQNFEMGRFSRKPIYNSINELSTSVTYKFYFADYTQNTTIPLTLNPTWYNSYESSNIFTPEELKINTKSIQKSFFKIDLYDTKNGRTQKNYLTLILNASLSLPTSVNNVIQSLIPFFELDHIGLNESYFIYWFKDFDILKLDKLYMRVKFFNAKTGEFTTFTTRKQIEINANNPFRVDNDYFYREVTFDFVNYLYDIIDSGESLPMLEWYEYINPPQNNS